MAALGLNEVPGVNCLFIGKTDTSQVWLLLYVDDLLIMSERKESMEKVKKTLSGQY